MNYEKPNRYSQDEVYLFHSAEGQDGVFYPVTFEVIGYRRKINGYEVDPSGAPMPKEQP